jgi:GntR family phosphonate transport system transcriptional regulator
MSPPPDLTEELAAPDTTLDRGGGITLWRQIADDLLAEITSGRLPPGERLPPEPELAKRFGVNRHTLRRALGVLVQEGRLTATPGRGTFVRDRPLAYPIGRRTRFSENITAAGLTPTMRLLAARTTAADAVTARRLALEEGAAVIALDLLREADGVPLLVATSTFPAAVCPDIAAVVAETGSISMGLAAHGITDYRRAETRISAALADAGEAVLLDMAVGRPLLVVAAVDVDPQGRPVNATVSRCAADRIEFVVGD